MIDLSDPKQILWLAESRSNQMPGPVSLVIAMFRIPGNNLNINTPNVNFPNMPHVDGPTFQAPTFQGPSISSSGIQGPYIQGPQVQGPYYNGPQIPGQSYDGSASTSAPSARISNESEGKLAGFWLGVLIFVWTLAIAALVLLGLYLAGWNVNPFQFQRFHAQDAMTAFTTANVEISRPVPYTTTGGFGTTQVPFTYVDGYNFTIPTSGPTATGGIVSFSSAKEKDAAKLWLTDKTKTATIPYTVYEKDNILVYLNVSSDTKAQEYDKALQTMKLK